MRKAASKIMSREALQQARQELRDEGLKVAFTNGCFDILHAGHVDYLEWARNQADALIVGLNSDASVRRNKGEKRPIVVENDRARVLAALECVDFIVFFDEDEPAALIEEILPDVLVKGEDWAHYVSGREAVEANGGRVALAPLVEGRSTTALIERIIAVYAKDED
jgi:rfaE bifunctional protein nucleotidyltransferase chain/domain